MDRDVGRKWRGCSWVGVGHGWKYWEWGARKKGRRVVNIADCLARTWRGRGRQASETFTWKRQVLAIFPIILFPKCNFAYKSQLSWPNLSWIFLPLVLTKLHWGFLTYMSVDFNEFCSKISNSPLYPMKKPKTSIIWKTRKRRAKQNEIWDPRVVVHLWGTVGLVTFKVISESFSALAGFHNWGLVIKAM